MTHSHVTETVFIILLALSLPAMSLVGIVSDPAEMVGSIIMPAPEATPDTLHPPIVYPVLDGGHSQAFREAYLHAYGMGNDFLSFHPSPSDTNQYEIVLGVYPGEWPDDRRYLLSDMEFLTLEAGFIVGDTIWIQ